MATQEKRDLPRSERYTKSEIALHDKAAAAEGKRTGEWRRDVVNAAAARNDEQRTHLEIMVKEMSGVLVGLAEQISKSNAAQIERGLAAIRGDMKAALDATVRAGNTPRPVTVDLTKVIGEIQDLREESLNAVQDLTQRVNTLFNAIVSEGADTPQSSAPVDEHADDGLGMLTRLGRQAQSASSR